MSAIEPEKPDRRPVQHLARQMLAEVEACPSLAFRSENLSGATKRRSSGPFPAMALLSDPALDIRQYLEDLVTIAVGSAQQTENMLVEVHKINRKARQRIAVFASFGALGLMVGIAGFTAGRSANVRLSEVRDEVSAFQKIGQDIATLEQQRKEAAVALSHQEAAREALQHQITDLQRQAISLRDQVAAGSNNFQAVTTELGNPRQNHQEPPAAQERSAAGPARRT